MRRKKRKQFARVLAGVGILTLLVSWQGLEQVEGTSTSSDVWSSIKSSIYSKAITSTFPVLAATEEPERETTWWQEIYETELARMLPLWSYTSQEAGYELETESQWTEEMLLAREGIDEYYRDGELVAGVSETEGSSQEENGENSSQGTGENDSTTETGVEAAQQETAEGEKKSTVAEATASAEVTATQPVVQISREKLNDFDYLIQNFYTVDKTTTIDSSQLNAQELLAMDLRLTTTSDQPQILIHHTHSQERYIDSGTDEASSIVGVGEYLTKLLQENYGFSVIHDTGVYDVIDHDNAYSYAGPAVEEILSEYPSIQVVIDMHRDGVEGDTRLVTEVNGKQTAQIMFFNGLSRTTTRGNLDYLYNPYLQENLAFSLQLKLAAEEYYPGFARSNYLKGYRYNLHYVPRSLLVEVGSQNNTLEEAMNAMEPLADLLAKVLTP